MTRATFALMLGAVLLAAPARAQQDDDEPPTQAPKGHGGGAGGGEMFQPPEDTSADAPDLPTGTLEILIADAASKPMPNTPVTLGIVYNSVAKGESRKRLLATTNAQGIARFENLETGSAVAYRPMVITEGTFSAMPFRMAEKGGMRAILHVYPVVDSLESATIVSQSIVYTEVKDDRIQVQQAYRIYNFGRTAWVPKDLVVPLPETFTAFTSQQGMTDIGAEAVPKKGVRLHGTFPPGQHVVEFRWQLPYTGEADVTFDVGMAPHTAASRVIAPASRDMKLEVSGFPPPRSSSDGQGQRALITEKQLRRDEPPLTSVTVAIKGLPTEGPGKIIATLLSACGLGLGLVLGTKRPSKKDRKIERARLLAELTELEKAHLAGDVGPKTYESARRDLLDALARTFAEDAPATAATSAKKKRR